MGPFVTLKLDSATLPLGCMLQWYATWPCLPCRSRTLAVPSTMTNEAAGRGLGEPWKLTEPPSCDEILLRILFWQLGTRLPPTGGGYPPPPPKPPPPFQLSFHQPPFHWPPLLLPPFHMMSQCS